MLTRWFLPLILSFALVQMTCQAQSQQQPSNTQEGKSMAFRLSSPAFAHEATIPVKYTCDGPDVSPPLKWDGLPDGTQSLVLICDDPDAPMGTWVHWVMYNIPTSVTELPEGVPTEPTVLNGIVQGINDFKRIGYGGPCPPAGKPHRYFFKLYAVDIPTNWESGLTKAAVLKKIEGHILGEAQLMGRYQR